MSFCSSPDRKTIFLPASGFGPLVGPSQGVWGPAYLATAALAPDTASARAGATANIPATATAPVSKAKWLTSTFMLLSSHFSSPRLRAQQDSFPRLPVGAERWFEWHTISDALQPWSNKTSAVRKLLSPT